MAVGPAIVERVGGELRDWSTVAARPTSIHRHESERSFFDGQEF